MAIAAFTFTSCEDVPSPFGEIVKPETGGGSAVIEPTGDGTEASPYNVAAVIEYVSGLGADVTSDKEVYIKGIVTEVTEKFGTQYGNATFVISDVESGGNKFTFYRGLYLGNTKYSKDTDTNIKDGDVVVICGKVVNYKGNTPETSQGNAYVVSINGQGGGTTPTPGGEDEIKTVTIADFNAAAESTSVWYQLTGTVKGLKDDDKYGNFDLEDATGSVYVYGLLAEKGGEKQKFQELAAAKGIKNGCKLTIIGNRGSFGDKIEVVNAYFVSVEAGSEPDTPTPGGGASGSGTQADPYNVQAIIDFVSGLSADTDTKKDLYVKGIITEIPSNGISTQYNNLTFYISDDASASNKFYVFRAKGLNGGDVTENMIKVGDEVVIFGSTWVNYKGNTPENKQGEAYIVSITPGSGGGGESGGGSTATSLTNGDFETWSGGQPTGWKSASTASSANLSQSTDAHGGSYSVKVEGDDSYNKRLASQEITLAAGTYEFAFYAKATTGDAAQVRPGYVPVKSGAVGSYGYGNYADINNNGWTKVTHEFTLSEETTVCLVVMNPKKSNYSAGKDVLIDDATLTKK